MPRHGSQHIAIRLLLGLAIIGVGLLGAQVPKDEGPPPLDETIVPALDAALADDDPRVHADALWHSSIIAHGSPEPLIEACQERLRERIRTILFESEEEDPSLDAPDIIALRRLTTRLLRILGDLDLARKLAEKIPESVETVEDILERAQILDALGENEAAHEVFGKLLDREIDETLRNAVLLRRALLLDPEKEREAVAASTATGTFAGMLLIPAGTAVGVRSAGGATLTAPVTSTGSGSPPKQKAEGERKLTPLAIFARVPERDVQLANQAAVILALRGEQKDAIDVFTTEDGEGSARFRQEVRLAEWALEAEEWDRAQEFAWAAVGSAKLQRDRRYSLTVLVEAYRRDGALPELIDRFADSTTLTDESRQAWIDLLRETGRVDQALGLFRDAAGEQFTIDMRRELLEMCRETGQEETLIDAYRQLIREEPRFIEWREGLSRFYLERGNREAAVEVWRTYLGVTDDLRYRMAAASTLMAIGLDDLAMEFARACESMGDEARNGALLFLYELHLSHSDMDQARATLTEIDESSPPTDPVRKDLSDAYSRLGDKERAVEVLERFRIAKGTDSNPDTDMKLALLLSDIGKEEEALGLWQEIWRAVDSIPRRRYVEERLMSVASRLGKLAKVAVGLERKIAEGTADDRDVGLLVRLYTHVKDPVSATEIVEEYWKDSGRKATEVLAEKARIFVACEDFFNYEKVVEELIEIDPEGRADYLRQLAMAKLEGGRRDEARAILEKLKIEESDSVSREFEAGVLALAGLREEALKAYRYSLAEHPERIDTYLLLSNLQKELGRHSRTAGMFQYLAETADKDDLFTIAIDGILNMRDGRANTGAPDRLVDWARRIVLERISRRADKLYLYRLLADLSAELGDTPGAIRALKMALPIAGEQRTPLLRELMALAEPAGGRQRGVIFAGRPQPDEPEVDNTEQLMFGRRLLGQGELVPPQVYLELGEAFLRSREVINATKTFQRMSQLPEYGELQTQIAEAFEKSRYPKEALHIYERILTVEPSDVGLLTKVGELHEQLGRDDLAGELYRRGLEIVLSRRPERKLVQKEKNGAPDPQMNWFANRNVDEAEQFFLRLQSGVIATLPFEGIEPLLGGQLAAIDAELAGLVTDAPTEEVTLEEFPRLEGRISCYRRFALAFGHSARLETLDRRLLAAFPDDKKILESMVRSRVSWGYVVAARRLLDESGRDAKERQKLALLVGSAGDGEFPGVIPVSEASARILPLLVEGHDDQVKELLTRLDLSTGEPSDQQRLPVLVSTALYLGDPELVLGLCRHWLNLMVQHSPDSLYGGVENILRQSGMILDEPRRRSLIEQLVDAVNENPDKFSSFVSRLPDLQKSLGSDLFTSEQVEELIVKRLEASDRFIYGIPEMFALLPTADRGPVARRIWPKLPKSQTGMFALQLLPVLDEEVDVSFADFLAGAFKQGVEQADDPQMFTYYVDQLTEVKSPNAAVALRYIRTLREKEPQDAGYRSGEALLLRQIGQEDAAWEIAAELYRDQLKSLGGNPDYRVRNAVNRIVEEFFEDHSDRFFALIDNAERDAGKDVELTKLRLQLLSRDGDEEQSRAGIEAAVEAFPAEVSFLQQLARLHSARGEAFRAIELEKRIVAAKPDDQRLLDNLVRHWRGLMNPVEALALLDAKNAETDEKAAAKKDRTPPATVLGVKDALERGDRSTAIATFRRLWRRFPTAGADPRFASMMIVQTSTGSFVEYGGEYTGRQIWPADPPSEEEQQKAREAAKKNRSRGGLPEISAPEEKEKKAPPEIRTAQDVFIAQGFGEGEIRRQLRSLSAGSLGNEVAGDIFRALAQKEAERVGAETALEGLLARERRGEVGKHEYGLIFALLELAEERSADEIASTLEGLLENVSPTDTGQLRRLARLAAKSGLSERAGTLYRWCAVVQPDRSNRFWDSADDLLGEVIEHLDGDEQIRTVEAVLALSDPGEEAFWGRENYERLVIQTWEKLLGPARALEKARAVCDHVTDLGEVPKRNAAQAASYLYAMAGETERALECLEVAICKLPVPDNLKYPWYRYQFEQTGWIGFDLQLKLLPEDSSAWVDPKGWYESIAGKVKAWQAEDRMSDDVAFQLLALCAARFHELGEVERSGELLDSIVPLAKDSANLQLWIADLARKFGDDSWADTIERTLADEGRLHLGRLSEVIARVREGDGPMLALALGEPAAKYSLDNELLDELVRSAEAAEQTDRATHWRERKAAAAAAQEELERRDREQ